MHRRPPALTAALALILALPLAPTHAQEAPSMPPLGGEQVRVVIPPGWQLAYANVQPNGNEVLEYLPAGQAIANWRGGYLLVSRYPYPANTGKTDLQQANATSVGDAAVNAIQQQAGAVCRGQGEFLPMSQHWNVFNGFRFSVSGGFCTHMGTAAPYGEGAVFAIVEGNDNLHQISFHWRPASTDEFKQRLPYWGAPDGDVERYLDAIKASTLCGGRGEPAC